MIRCGHCNGMHVSVRNVKMCAARMGAFDVPTQAQKAAEEDQLRDWEIAERSRYRDLIQWQS